MQMLMTIQGMRTIRAYGQEEAHQELFTHNSFDAREVTNALARLSAWIGPVTEVGYLGILCVIIAGFELVAYQLHVDLGGGSPAVPATATHPRIRR